MPHLVYVQSTGVGFRSDATSDTPLFHGYSGSDAHKNSPASESISDGPIPVGWYEIVSEGDHADTQDVIPLKPDLRSKMYGRSGFLIRGVSTSAAAGASQNCIIVNEPPALAELAGPFKQLQVVARSQTCAEFGALVTNANSTPSLLGKGYSSAARSFSAFPIIDEAALCARAQAEGASDIPQFGMLASEEDFENALNVDATVGGSYEGFGAKAHARLRRRFSTTETSVSIALTRRVVTGVFDLVQRHVAKEAEEEADRDPARFVRSYGDSLVVSVGVGGACCFVLRFEFDKESEATQFRASFKMNYLTAAEAQMSVEMHRKMLTANARVFFTGYTTGTLRAQPLFDPDEKDGLSYVFDSHKLGADMISALLREFDEFPSYFEGGTDEPGSLHQCQVNHPPLSRVPLILPHQDVIAKIGARESEIATSLRRQRDYLFALDAQLTYMTQVVEDQNIPQALREAAAKLQEIATLVADVDSRLNALVDNGNTADVYDFTARFPTIEDYYCTADPLVQKKREVLPRDQWSSYGPIHPNEYDKTCRFTATVHAETAGYEPNGCDCEIRLYKVPLDAAVSPGSSPPPGDFIDRQSGSISRGSDLFLTVGGDKIGPFVPSQIKGTYQIFVHIHGDYHAAATITVETRISQQTPIITLT